jgi:hypothetical protein
MNEPPPQDRVHVAAEANFAFNLNDWHAIPMLLPQRCRRIDVNECHLEAQALPLAFQEFDRVVAQRAIVVGVNDDKNAG